MKFMVLKPVEIDVVWVVVSLPVRYGEEDIPADFPLRDGDVWRGTIEVETGRILGWPAGRAEELSLKVCDGGSYVLVDGSWNVLYELIEEYVPHCMIPGEYGDYVEFQIGADGVIKNWPASPEIDAWVDSQE